MTRLTNNGHGGHRANQNGPTPTPNRRTRGLRRKKKNFKKKKGTASDYRRLEMMAKLATDDDVYCLIGVIFGYHYLSWDDLQENKYLHAKEGGFKLKLYQIDDTVDVSDELPIPLQE
eukprot:926756_1